LKVGVVLGYNPFYEVFVGEFIVDLGSSFGFRLCAKTQCG
jgi:hypothetical protein